MKNKYQHIFQNINPRRCAGQSLVCVIIEKKIVDTKFYNVVDDDESVRLIEQTCRHICMGSMRTTYWFTVFDTKLFFGVHLFFLSYYILYKTETVSTFMLNRKEI